MIGKVVKGRSFKVCISYVMDKENVKLIDSEAVLLNNTKSIINSFYMQSLMNPDLSKCVGHIPLSYAKEDEPKLTDAFMVQLAKEYMEAMKIKNTQYIIVRHNNTPNPHCHIVFNRVDNNGETISDKKDWHENIKVCKVLKEKYNLTYGKGKEQVNTNKLKGAEKTKYEIYHSIKTALLMSKNWQEFEHTLKLQGVSIAYKYKGQTNEIQGVSFKKGEHSFKGSDVDRKFSYSKMNNPEASLEVSSRTMKADHHVTYYISSHYPELKHKPLLHLDYHITLQCLHNSHLSKSYHPTTVSLYLDVSKTTLGLSNFLT